MVNAVRPQDMLFKYLRLANSPTGSRDMHIDATVPKIFGYTVPENNVIVIARMNIVLIDGAMMYGKIGGTAVSGHSLLPAVLDSDGNALIDFLDIQGAEAGIEANEDFGALAGIDNIVENAAGDDSLATRWTLNRATGGKNMLMFGGETFQVTATGNYSGLTKLRMFIQGEFIETAKGTTGKLPK